MSVASSCIAAVERGFVPDTITRIAIRRLCRERLRSLAVADGAALGKPNAELLKAMRSGPVALDPHIANQQHYELPAEFFEAVLGPRRKYSCCYFPDEDTSLAVAEEIALAMTCRRAKLEDGQEILELGCGWGSLSLWMAERFPNARILAVSNSAPQRRYIEAAAAARGVRNLQVQVADMNDFSPGRRKFDRVVSVEMFEHMRNYDLLLRRIASWLAPCGKLFVHVFCHRVHGYAFESSGDANWMGRYFFTGGIMPSADLLYQFNCDLAVTRYDSWSGWHYQRTAEAWLANLDSRRDDVMNVFVSVYGASEAALWLNRWRMFFLSVSELFGYSCGEEWRISHYLMEPVNGRARCRI